MLQINDLSRKFGDRIVLDNVSFKVRSGRMTGFVGQNGAGKTTTMRIILGVLRPDSGEVLFDNLPLDKGMRARFGYMPEERGLYPKMKVAEQLIYLGQLHGMSAAAARDATLTLLADLGLANRARDPLEKLSLGNQQRVQIAASLVHGPIALVLDEPFSGLDPVAVITGMEVLRRYAATGVPVIFSSHQLDIVERLCDDLVVIDGGRVAVSGSKEQIRSTYDENRYYIKLSLDMNGIEVSPPDGVAIVGRDAGGVQFTAETEDAASQMLTAVLDRVGAVHLRGFGLLQESLPAILAKVLTK